MALQRFAREAACKLNLRSSFPPAAAAFACGLKESVLRGYATVADNAKYAKSHEWAMVDGDVATLGISDFAQAELGDVVYVELPEHSTELKAGETFGVIESVKAASDVYSPVSGEVLETNSGVVDEPGKVNGDPFGDGWLVKVKLSNPSELDALMDAGAYKEHCESAGH